MGKNINERKIILTGDRPTGKLHLGHYAGSLENRIKLQDEYEIFVIVADFQVLTDHIGDTTLVEQSIHDLVLDYLAVGIDPEKSNIFVQSRIPAIAELTVYFSMLVSLPRLQRNPTVKEELKKAGSQLTYGFLGYPISQAADILAFNADLIPVGEDQVAHIEQTREIARDFNKTFNPVFKIPEALVGKAKRMPGIDGDKMSKSRNNAIYLSDSPNEVKQKIIQAKTDPARIHPNDPGHPDVCVIFQYYEYFNNEKVAECRDRCEKGTISCIACKAQIAEKINEFLRPIQEKRKLLEQDKQLVSRVLKKGTQNAIDKTDQVIKRARQAMHYDYPTIF